MSRSFERLSQPNNVVAGGRVTQHCPLGLSYDSIIFKLTNVTPVQMKNLKVLTGAKAQWDVKDGGVIADINSYYQRDESTGFLTLWFYRPEMSTEEERALTSMGTLDIPSLTVQFDLDGAVTDPAIETYAIRRAAAPMGLITKLREFPTTFATSGRQDIDNIPRGARITAFHLFKDDVSEVELEINNGAGSGKVVEFPKDLLEAVQKQHGRTPLTAKATHVDMNLLGKLKQYMPTAHLKDMRLKPTIDSSGALTTLVEYIDGFQGI
ncbi:major capsid protein P2 [Alkalimarinus coralli]|uniref:major capsid protein P2 n=1 Tax=Alkalimarinus coralli TaxID=2935863 RepID=UPI00202AD01F|nr:major capsid protein P2 [Alkalimarinus coralli]